VLPAAFVAGLRRAHAGARAHVTGSVAEKALRAPRGAVRPSAGGPIDTVALSLVTVALVAWAG
jgi:hypothetical protein